MAAPDDGPVLDAASRIRLLAVDVDGTLAGRDNFVSPRTRAALRELHAAGMGLAIATGRRYRTTRRVIDGLELPLPAVCLGGSLVKRADHVTLAKSPFPRQEWVGVVELARELGASVALHHDAPIDRTRDFLIDHALPWNAATARYFERAAPFAHRCDVLADAHGVEDVLIISVFSTEDHARFIAAAAAHRYGGRVVATVVPHLDEDVWYCELARADVSKWSGLTRLAAELGIGPDEICAVGDEANDIPMLRGAAVGIAMGNAPAHVQAAADWVTDRYDADGLARAVEWLLRARGDTRRT